MRINVKTTFTPLVSLVILYFIPQYTQINPAGTTAFTDIAFLLMRILSRIFTTNVAVLDGPKYPILASNIDAVNIRQWEHLEMYSSKGMSNLRGPRSVGLGLLIRSLGMDIEISPCSVMGDADRWMLLMMQYSE